MRTTAKGTVIELIATANQTCQASGCRNDQVPKLRMSPLTTITSLLLTIGIVNFIPRASLSGEAVMPLTPTSHRVPARGEYCNEAC